jgi:type IV secretory pathway VirB2 component (pilin)
MNATALAPPHFRAHALAQSRWWLAAAAASFASVRSRPASAQLGGTGSAGGTSLITYFNNLANLIISDVGTIICLIALAIACLVVALGWAGAGILGRAIGGIGGLWCCAWIIARLTGGANTFGGA